MAKPHDLPYVPAGFDLEPEIVDQLSSRPGSQRCVVGRDELLLIVHDLPKTGSSERESVIFWRRDDGAWLDTQGGRGLKRLSELVDRFAGEIRRLESAIGNAATAAEVFALARVSGPFARCSRNLAAAIDQALVQDEDSRELRSLRDRVREVERGAEMFHHDTRLTLEFWQVERVEKQQAAVEKLHRTVSRLTLVASIFLPLVALTGLFSMNGEVGRALAWTILIIGLLAGAWVFYKTARKSGVGPFRIEK